MRRAWDEIWMALDTLRIWLMGPYYRSRCRRGVHHDRDGLIGGVSVGEGFIRCVTCDQVVPLTLEMRNLFDRAEEARDRMLREWG